MLTMNIINLYEAKTHLSKVINQAVKGEEVVIARSGKPVVRLVPYDQSQTMRKPGIWKGKVKVDPDFDASSPQMEKLFYGE